MILVDTSVLISYLKNQNNESNSKFEYILERRLPYGINLFIYQEILQGARNIKEYNLLKKYFETIPLYHLRYGQDSYENAAMINLKCRQRGITIRSTIDLLIAETAIENDLYLLHNDNDFTNMAKVIKELKLYN
ncbi:PIN domain nuclease [Treponema sp. OMZ 787]|uniref:type II toxin-antitoxin system VapC family toxin n=1 Tax=Treponema sp. OMZ 787 TaxID=2563669 RepID=UPI0020A43F92|nr:PIN domain nuclease [Treponema sp. OMZ 787]UTC62236.1 PIN domain nuclease [Treponema sp. OMZ 787]